MEQNLNIEDPGQTPRSAATDMSPHGLHMARISPGKANIYVSKLFLIIFQ